MSDNKNIITDFLKWMNENRIDSVIPFLVAMEGKDATIPHWTNGKRLFTASDLYRLYSKKTKI